MVVGRQHLVLDFSRGEVGPLPHHCIVEANVRLLTSSLIAASISCFAVAASVPAHAQAPAYSAEQVTRHFETQRTRSLLPASASNDGAPRSRSFRLKEGESARAVCIGTRDECDAQRASSGQPSLPDEHGAFGDGFNLVITFNHASYDLTFAAQQNLREFARGISSPKLRRASFVIEGHTDGFGSPRYNQELSENRAQAVTNFLISLGVDPWRLRTVGHGESRPKMSNLYHPGNRRVEGRLMVTLQ